MLRSTFLGYKTATSALKVHQNYMDVTGQNMANVNTKGYTRQRLDTSSFGFTARNLKFSLGGVVIGQGVNSLGVSQYRDAFLDLRYRTAAAKTGDQETQLEALIDVESILDEIMKEGMDSQFSDLLDQLHELTKSPSDPVLEGVVRTSAQLLTQMLNNYATQLETVREQQLEYMEKGATVDVNQLLKNISILNQQIKEANIGGNPALELNDERNLLIDELSSYLDIEVKIDKINIGGDNFVDELSINLKLSDGIKIKIIDNDEFAEFESGVPTGATDVEFRLKNNIDTGYTGSLDLTDRINNGQIGGYIKFLNGKGEYAATGDVDAKNKGIQYYQNMLDTLANKFARTMNNLNREPNFAADGTVDSWTSKRLFESRETGPITAKSIKISDAWAAATESYITNTIVKSDGDDSTGATDNILRMIDAFKEKNDFTTQFNGGGNGLFKGTFQEFVSFTITKLNLQTDDVEKTHESYLVSQYQIDYERSSLSSVDFNEEGVNLLQYSKSYNAAARLMTTLDEMLDTLINRMGV
ncbi:flagellar hook-associated protein FlgK [Sedimentibacter hydroxybenzoicus DSM 7310]|uniref:Flagellar hook-associated protein 1 n=1 Tax=Sedimentibacter hydroxybenzoicus DSM 7310 TaxID=1123245 RepID=A0A974BGE6_SEDHY|nr:flagellar hook-associated protein FlgK [Sedimentibacter hydroxybenzoicus]NYB72582.1 flagellar hook-associated protein FlgK [Sedimentibacter hydroxybenzoicus DSM 7310]